MNHRLIAAVASVALLLGCSDDTSFSDQLKQLAEQRVGDSIKIDSAIASAWDEFAIFGAYFPKEYACESLGLSAWQCFWLPYAKPDDSSPNLVVFLNKKEVVFSAFLPRCGVQIRPYDPMVNRSLRRQGTFLVETDASCTQPNYLLKQQ